MAGIAHIGIGLAAKKAAPKVHVGFLCLASEAIDILWAVLALVGVESFDSSPWSHGLLMAVIWSVTGGLLGWYFYRDSRSGGVIGLVIFSHWVLDFITHPMFGGLPDLALLLEGSPKVGLGLYSAIPMGLWVVIELGLVAVGLWTSGILRAKPAWRKPGRLEVKHTK